MPNASALPIILHESRAKLVVLLAVMVMFVALGVLLIQGDDFWLGLGAIIFCGAAAIAIIKQLRSDRVRSLHVDTTGLTYYSLAGSAHVPWKDIASFGLARVKTATTTQKFISWKYSPQAIRPSSYAFMDMSVLGFDAGCPALGLPAEELLKLLNEFHDRYGHLGS